MESVLVYIFSEMDHCFKYNVQCYPSSNFFHDSLFIYQNVLKHVCVDDVSDDLIDKFLLYRDCNIDFRYISVFGDVYNCNL